MGKVKDRILELEEEGIIEWSEEFEQYVLTDDPDNKLFDLSDYLFARHLMEEREE